MVKRSYAWQWNRISGDLQDIENLEFVKNKQQEKKKR